MNSQKISKSKIQNPKISLRDYDHKKIKLKKSLKKIIKNQKNNEKQNKIKCKIQNSKYISIGGRGTRYVACRL